MTLEENVRYVCAQNCPECEGSHCKTSDIEFFYETLGGCPVGNNPILVEL